MVTLLDNFLIEQLVDRAKLSDRGRTNHNFHPQLEDPVQRMLNALEMDSYVQPHRHSGSDRWEFFIALTGCCVVLTFDEHGEVLSRNEIAHSGPVRGVEIAPGVWHSITAMQPGSVVFELKQGPYQATTDKDFAHWAPPEKDSCTQQWTTWFRHAQVGDRFKVTSKSI